MTLNKQTNQTPEPGRNEAKIPYAKPEIKRVDLALEETMSEGCKLAGTECTDPVPGISQAGS